MLSLQYWEKLYAINLAYESFVMLKTLLIRDSNIFLSFLGFLTFHKQWKKFSTKQLMLFPHKKARFQPHNFQINAHHHANS